MVESHHKSLRKFIIIGKLTSFSRFEKASQSIGGKAHGRPHAVLDVFHKSKAILQCEKSSCTYASWNLTASIYYCCLSMVGLDVI